MNTDFYFEHNNEILQHKKNWGSKKVLQKVYTRFYQLIAKNLRYDLDGQIVELGSGLGNIKSVIDSCICTDVLDNPWIDRTENAYKLNFGNSTISNLILFDVWMYMEFPGTVLKEFQRVLQPGGRVIIFEPDISLFGFLIYNLLHHLDVGYKNKINWLAPTDFSPDNLRYFVAQGNASRIFRSKKYNEYLSSWRKVKLERLSAIEYIFSGGYSKPQLYPDFLFTFMTAIGKILNLVPQIFSTRLLVVLEKK